MKGNGFSMGRVHVCSKLEQSDGRRNTLIKRGLIRKMKDGAAVRYYPI